MQGMLSPLKGCEDELRLHTKTPSSGEGRNKCSVNVSSLPVSCPLNKALKSLSCIINSWILVLSVPLDFQTVLPDKGDL